MRTLKLFGEGEGCSPCVFSMQVIKYDGEEVLFCLRVRIGDSEFAIHFRNLMITIGQWANEIWALKGRDVGRIEITDDDNSLVFSVEKFNQNTFISMSYESILPYYILQEEANPIAGDFLAQGSKFQIGQVLVANALVLLSDYLAEEFGFFGRE